MSEDRGDTQDPAEDEDARQDYVAPKVTDLGSFEKLTKNGFAAGADTEVAS
jgi:hypothetical protein